MPIDGEIHKWFSFSEKKSMRYTVYFFILWTRYLPSNFILYYFLLRVLSPCHNVLSNHLVFISKYLTEKLKTKSRIIKKFRLLF